MQAKGEELLYKLLKSFNTDVRSVLELFNPDAVVVYPYAPGIQQPSQLNMAQYEKHLQAILPTMPVLYFTGVKVFEISDGKSFWAEAHGEVSVPASDKIYKQDYVIYFEMENGRFSLYKEYWNPVAFTDAYNTK